MTKIKSITLKANGDPEILKSVLNHVYHHQRRSNTNSLCYSSSFDELCINVLRSSIESFDEHYDTFMNCDDYVLQFNADGSQVLIIY